MNWSFIFLGCLFLVLAGLTGADYASTSISTDGGLMLASVGNCDNGSFASRVMTVDQSEISRSVSGGDTLETDLSVKGSGPVLVSDYASGKTWSILDKAACVFLTDARMQPVQSSELYFTGVVDTGRYKASRVVGPGLAGGTEVNGSGMMNFGSHTVGNNTLRSSGFAFGNMTVRDFVRYGGRV